MPSFGLKTWNRNFLESSDRCLSFPIPKAEGNSAGREVKYGRAVAAQICWCSAHLSLSPQDTQTSGQRLGDAGSGFGITAGGSELAPRPAGLTHSGFFSSQILKRIPTPPESGLGVDSWPLVDAPSLPRSWSLA